MANLRRVHSAWDKTRREWQALVHQSQGHDNTRGCKFESDLANMTKKGNSFDVVIEALEGVFLGGAEFDGEQIKQAADATSTLNSIIKEGAKKAAAMRPWFKLA